MNTIGGHLPILPKDKSRLLFDDKEIDFGFPEWQIDKILDLWNRGKGVNHISKLTERTPHEVFFVLYEAWMDGYINNIEKAFFKGGTLLVPGKEQKRKGGDENQ